MIPESLKRLIEFLKFENRLNKINNNTPTYEKFEKYMTKDWVNIGSARMKCSPKMIRKLLPLVSLRITDSWMSGEYSIAFKQRELYDVLGNKLNKVIVKFLDTYLDNHWNTRLNIYFENKDTFILLLDAIESRNEINVEQEVISIINYLLDEIKTEKNTSSKINTDTIKQRLEVELEFIKRREEAGKF